MRKEELTERFMSDLPNILWKADKIISWPEKPRNVSNCKADTFNIPQMFGNMGR